MINTEIYIENYRADVSADISSLLNFALDDLKDFSARTTTFSRTIILPGTSGNNQLFGNIFQITQANEYSDLEANVGYNFNASKSADCVIFQDQLQTFKGSLRLMQINIIKGRIEYEVAVFGQLTGLNVALSSGLIEDLDFSAYDQVYNASGISTSWDNPGGSGIYYPLVDYGQVSNDKHNFEYTAFRPALYVKEYIDKMFAEAGFRYSSALFNTDRFKKLIVPCNTKDLRKLSSTILLASVPNNSPVLIDFPTPISENRVGFDIVSTSAFTASDSNRTFTYTDTPNITLLLSVRLFGTYFSDDTSLLIYLRKNGVEIPGTRLQLTRSIASKDFEYDSGSISVSFVTGDFIDCFVIKDTDSIGYPSDSYSMELGGAYMDISSPAAIPVPILVGDTIAVNDTIPKNVRQIDFLMGIVKLFNLYVYEDRLDTRLIYLTPYVDFYSTDPGNAVDWTYKVNRDKPIKLKPMSEINAKLYNFKYKQDNDYWNELYRKRYGKGYGDYIFDSMFEFAEASKSVDICFSATPLVSIGGEDKVFPAIYKSNNSTEEAIDSNIRILQTMNVSGVTSWDLMDGASVLASYTKYGYAGHYNNPDAPSNDLNFGVPEELFFVLATGDITATQFNIYWSPYMAEITDKDSKLLQAFFRLTAKDIIELDFSKYVYVDGALFRLNKIIDYNVSRPGDCEAHLLKAINLIY